MNTGGPAPLPPVGDGEEYVMGTQDVRLYCLDEPREARIVAWRILCFERIGFATADARILAQRRDVDRVRVEGLVQQGCSVGLIMEIVL